jgi:hypothetical protein
MNWKETRVGEVILGNGMNPALENHVRSSLRVVSVEENGLKVTHVHASLLTENMPEWVLRWDQLEKNGNSLLPNNTQLPLL